MSNDHTAVPMGLRIAIATAGIGAAAIHFAMVPSHSQDWLVLGIGFAVVGWAQAIAGGLAAVRPRAPYLLAVVAVHVLATAMWVWSRTTGFPFGPDAGTAEAVSSVDLTAVALQAAGVLAAGTAWAATRQTAEHEPGAWLRPASAMAAVIIGAGSLVGSSAVLASPAAMHDHGHGEADHPDDHDDDGSDHNDLAAADHVDPVDGDHSDQAAGDHSDRAEGDHSDQAEGDHADDHEAPTIDPVLGLDVSSLTEAEIDRGRELVTEMDVAMAAYSTPADVEAAGYISIGDSVTGYEHFIHIGYLADDVVMDPARIESIVFEVAADGTKELVSGMYILPFGDTMDDVPDLGAGEVTVWHDHQNLCWQGARVVGILDDAGNCPRGEFRATSPMLHVWVVDHECGRFSGLEGSHGEGCNHDH